MKKRNTAIATFLLFAAISLGVGYAALTDSFTVQGELGANVNNDNLVVVFDGETQNTSEVSSVDETYCNFATPAGAAAIDGKNICELTYSGLTTAGQVANATLRVENRSTNYVGTELDATLSSPTVDYGQVDQQLFKITATWENSDLTLAPGESNNLLVIVELLKTTTTSVTAKDFSIKFSATTA
jgi:hypothetical protein